MTWRRHQDHLRQCSVIDSEAKHSPGASIPPPMDYPDVLVPDDSTDTKSKDQNISKGIRAVEHPSPRRNPKCNCTCTVSASKSLN